MDLNEKIAAIQADNKHTESVTARELINHFGYQRRSWGNCAHVVRFLEAKEIELSSDPYKEWIDAPITMSHKAIATTKVPEDVIKRVLSMAAANHKPVFVDRNDSLEHAVTLMLQNDYSQLPVVSGGERTLIGFISWKTIGLSNWRGAKGDKVADFMSDQITTIKRTETLLKAIEIVAQKEFAVVLKEDKTMSGIITTADVAAEFFSITQAEAFLLLEQIELQIRNLISRGGILLEEIQKVCAEEGRTVNCIDDLTFGEYVRIFENPKHWKKINIKNEKDAFVAFLNQIREVRNDVMHFEPDGIGSEKLETLRNMSRYLSELL